MNEFMSEIWTTHAEMILAIGYNMLLGICVLVASHFLTLALHRSIKRAYERLEGMDPTLLPILCKTGTVAIYGIGVVVILDIFGVNTTSMIALLGAAGLAIGLALKDTLSNIAAGTMLLILRPFKVGHSIECGSIAGSVLEIGLFTTVLKTRDGLYLSAPNSAIWGSSIKNITRNGTRRIEIIVGISYSDSIDKGFEVFQKIIENEPRILPEPKPEMMVQAMADSSVNLQLRVWTIVGDYWATTWDLNKQIKEGIAAAGLTIPFPQRDVYIHNEAS